MLKQHLRISDEFGLFDTQALQGYVLVACQSNSGLFDKPGSASDYYHTAYALAGLSLFQHPNLFKETTLELNPIDPLVNTLVKNTQDARKFFLDLD
jgi:Prenyltransferase, beta subunit